MPKYTPLFLSLPQPESCSFIYGLIDPDTKALRYVGKTGVGWVRIREHYARCHRRNSSGYFSASKQWIRKLKENNKIFDIVYLEYLPVGQLDDAEQFYISYFKFLGCELLNHEIGGSRGKHGLNTTTHRAKMKTVMNQPDVVEKCRISHLGQPAWNKGLSMTEETKRKVSRAQDSKVHYLQDQFGRIYRGYKQAAKALNIEFTAIYKAIKAGKNAVHGTHIWRIPCPRPSS